MNLTLQELADAQNTMCQVIKAAVTEFLATDNVSFNNGNIYVNMVEGEADPKVTITVEAVIDDAHITRTITL